MHVPAGTAECCSAALGRPTVDLACRESSLACCKKPRVLGDSYSDTIGGVVNSRLQAMADISQPTPLPGAVPEQPSYAHPVAAFFLFFFKAAAVFIYIFCGWFKTDFVINFCTITFLLVCDFWTVRAAGGNCGCLASVCAALQASLHAKYTQRSVAEA
jgi:hypothetical protein